MDQVAGPTIGRCCEQVRSTAVEEAAAVVLRCVCHLAAHLAGLAGINGVLGGNGACFVATFCTFDMDC